MVDRCLQDEQTADWHMLVDCMQAAVAVDIGRDCRVRERALVEPQVGIGVDIPSIQHAACLIEKASTQSSGDSLIGFYSLEDSFPWEEGRESRSGIAVVLGVVLRH